MDSSSVKAIITPVDGYRGQLRSQGKRVKNHHKANLRHLDQMQQTNVKKAI